MKISVVVATCNGEEFVYDKLESLRNQNRSADDVIIGGVPVRVIRYRFNNKMVHLIRSSLHGCRKNTAEALTDTSLFERNKDKNECLYCHTSI